MNGREWERRRWQSTTFVSVRVMEDVDLQVLGPRGSVGVGAFVSGGKSRGNTNVTGSVLQKHVQTLVVFLESLMSMYS